MKPSVHCHIVCHFPMSSDMSQTFISIWYSPRHSFSFSSVSWTLADDVTTCTGLHSYHNLLSYDMLCIRLDTFFLGQTHNLFIWSWFSNCSVAHIKIFPDHQFDYCPPMLFLTLSVFDWVLPKGLRATLWCFTKFGEISFTQRFNHPANWCRK